MLVSWIERNLPNIRPPWQLCLTKLPSGQGTRAWRTLPADREGLTEAEKLGRTEPRPLGFYFPPWGELTGITPPCDEGHQGSCLGKPLHLLFRRISGCKKMMQEPSEWLGDHQSLWAASPGGPESLRRMVRDDILWSLGRQPLSPTQLPLSSVFLLHAGSTAAKGGEPHGNPAGGYICRWTSGGRSHLASCRFRGERPAFHPLLRSGHLEIFLRALRKLLFFPRIGFSPPLHENDSEFRLIALCLIVC